MDEIVRAASRGVCWLLDVQNKNGGWPTFCRGWGKMPFDRSGTDLTAHALRALHAWRERLPASANMEKEIDSALSNEVSITSNAYNARDGSWVPLWFGNQYHRTRRKPGLRNRPGAVAYRDLRFASIRRPAQRGLEWLRRSRTPTAAGAAGIAVERPALVVQANVLAAVEALPAAAETTLACRAAGSGLDWLLEAVETKQSASRCSPIGFYFAKLWYYEKLYP